MTVDAADANALRAKFKAYHKNPYIYNDIIDLFLTLILYFILALIILNLKPKFNRF